MNPENPMIWEKLGQINLSRREAIKLTGAGTVGITALMLVGCEDDSDPARFTINLPASENRIQVIEELFENSLSISVVMLPDIDHLRESSLDNIWRVGGARLEKTNLFANRSGRLTILLDQPYTSSEADLVGALITDDNHEITVENIKLRRAQDAIDEQFLPPEEYDKTVIELEFNDNKDRKVTVDDLRDRLGLTVYLEIRKSNAEDEPIRSVYKITPLSEVQNP